MTFDQINSLTLVVHQLTEVSKSLRKVEITLPESETERIYLKNVRKGLYTFTSLLEGFTERQWEETARWGPCYTETSTTKTE